MPTPTNYIVGKDVSVSVGGVLLYCSGGNIDDVVAELPKSNSRSACYTEVAAGLRGCKGTLNCFLVGSDPPTIEPGQYVALIINTAGNACGGELTATTGLIYTVTVLINQASFAWTAEGDATWALSFTSNGAYTVVAG